MNNRGVSIRYGDVAPEAKENFVPSASESEFDTLAQMQQYNLNFLNYANPCELYSVVLDGTASAFPSVPENANLGLWSEQISNDDGTFTEPIVLELESVGQYSSQGLTLTFDTYNGIHPTRLSIKWLRITDDGITTLDEKEFTPDNAFYFCHNFVENYNKVVITFHSLNMPKNRLKLRAIDYGYGTIFYGDELRNTKILQEINPISSEVSINTADFTLDSKTDMEYSFQQKQPLSIYFNGELKATTFVKSSKRKARFLWDIQSEDYIGLMDSIPFYGDIYTNKNALELIDEIFTQAKVPYSVEGDSEEETVTGLIPYTTCREALMQVAFALQVVVDTSGSDVVKIFKLEEDVKQTIPLNRIKQGQNFTDDETVTSVEITQHRYTESTENTYAYRHSESGLTGEISVVFPEPLHDLTILQGEILYATHTFAKINAQEGCQFWGKNYEHTTSIATKKNRVVLQSEIEKVVSVDNATLVSANNIDKIVYSCYNWLTKTNTTNLKIVDGKHVQYGEPIKWGQKKWGTFKWGQKYPNIVTYDEPVNVGENISAETEYLGNVTGRIIKQSFNLNGNIIVKEAVLK